MDSKDKNTLIGCPVITGLILSKCKNILTYTSTNNCK